LREPFARLFVVNDTVDVFFVCDFEFVGFTDRFLFVFAFLTIVFGLPFLGFGNACFMVLDMIAGTAEYIVGMRRTPFLRDKLTVPVINILLDRKIF
jgi:hypothetical protein